MKDRQINAFATLGGYIGVNAGLVLTAEREDEVAAVLSHEIAHVTQQHVLRGVERAQRDQIPILLGMLAAVVAAQASNSVLRQRDHGRDQFRHGPDAAAADQLHPFQRVRGRPPRHPHAVAQRYDVDAMAGFFERMASAMRGNEGGYSVPEFLRTHPVNITRISEAKARAEQMKKDTVLLTTTTPAASAGSAWTRPTPAWPSPCCAETTRCCPATCCASRWASSAAAPVATSTGRASACACSARTPRPSWNASMPTWPSARRTASTMPSAMARRWL